MNNNWFSELKEKLLDKTDNGLDIIERFFSIDTSKIDKKKGSGTKQFKSPFRNEKTASAQLFQRPKDKQWGIKDFGDGSFISAIDAYMKQNHFAQGDVTSALLELCMSFSIEVEKGQPVFRKPIIKSEKSEEKPWEFEPAEWTAIHVAVFNPRANSDSEQGQDLFNELVAKAEFYGLQPIKSYSYSKVDEHGDMRRITFSATDVYPMFIWLQGEGDNQWAKVYEPYADENKDSKYKGSRFRHLGTKPERFIYGLAKLKACYEKSLQREIEKLQEKDEEYKVIQKLKYEYKLPEVIVCTGGSDGLNVAALGYYTMWSNSESNYITPQEYQEIKKYAHEVYYVGDLDETGMKAAHTMGMMYLDCKIIRLPEELKKFRGWRNKVAKDVKDYCRYFSASQFAGLMRIACPYQYWSYEPTSRGVSLQFQPIWALHHLHHQGFYKFKNKATKSGFEIIRVQGNVVTQIEPDELKTYLKDFAIEKRQSRDIVNLILRTKAIREEFARDLQWFNGSFKRHTEKSQYWFFPNEIWEISADGAKVMKHGQVNVYSWSDKVYTNPADESVEIKISDDPWTIEEQDGDYSISGINYSNQFVQFLVNTSRVHWQEEFKLAKVDANLKQKEATELQLNRIDGSNLSAEKRHEQILHLLSKITAVGYMLHTYKMSSRAWAPWITENAERDIKEANGGTGKSLLLKYIHSMMLKCTWKDGRNIKDDKFKFGGVDRTTELLLIADADRSTSLGEYYNAITDGMENRSLYSLGEQIPFEEAPKIVFLSNYFPWDLNPSDLRRLWPIGFADYYHAIGGLHQEERNPANDMGRELYSSWSPKEWNEFFNILRACLQAYLKYGRINPPMTEMNRQMSKVSMGQNFEDWSKDFFPEYVNTLPSGFVPTMGNCGDHIFIPVKVAVYEYTEYLKKIRSTRETINQQVFMKKLDAYAKYNGFVMNPVSLRNGGNRIVKKATSSILNMLRKINPDKEAHYEGDKPLDLKWCDSITIKHNDSLEVIYLGCYQDKLRMVSEQEDDEVYKAPEDVF